MTDIAITDLTNKTENVSGTGIFDVLIETVKLHLNEQFSEGRITGAEYATVYLGAIQSTLQHALTFLLSEQEASKKIELLERQIAEAEERKDLVIAQTAQVYETIAASQAKTSRETLLNNKKIDLIAAQTLGFASDTKQKVLKQMMDGYAVNLSIAGVGNVPEANQDAAIDQLAQELLNDIGSSVIIQSIAQVPSSGTDPVTENQTDPDL